jgi:hypothetical protein
MHRRAAAQAFAAALAVLAWPAGAQTDPLKSPACAEALAALDVARRDKAVDIERVRQAASRTCLGAAAPQPPPSRGLQPSASVAPVRVVPSPPPPPAAAEPSAAGGGREPLRIDRTTIATHCDAGGCWDAQGQRLQRDGAHLIGPGGPCLPQAGGFACP